MGSFHASMKFKVQVVFDKGVPVIYKEFLFICEEVLVLVRKVLVVFLASGIYGMIFYR